MHTKDIGLSFLRDNLEKLRDNPAEAVTLIPKIVEALDHKLQRLMIELQPQAFTDDPDIVSTLILNATNGNYIIKVEVLELSDFQDRCERHKARK